MTDNFLASRAQRLIDEFEEGETVAGGIARVLGHLAYAFDMICDDEGESMVGVPVSTLDQLAVELRNAPQPAPTSPTDEELYDLFDWLKDEWHSNDEREFPLPLFARAVLVRWGSHPPRSNS
jgi:hypothetical protein